MIYNEDVFFDVWKNDLNKWDFRFLSIAKLVSEWSKDPSTKVGAVFVIDKRILSTGYNGFPVGILDSDCRLHNREEKLNHIIHAEMNGIFNACRHGVNVQNSTLYTYGLPVCCDCAKGVIQVGVKRIVSMTTEDRYIRWESSINKSSEMFNEGKVKSMSLVIKNDIAFDFNDIDYSSIVKVITVI